MQKQPTLEEYQALSLIDYLKILNRYKKVITGIVIAGAAISLVFTLPSQTPVYRSTAALSKGYFKDAPILTKENVSQAMSPQGIEVRQESGSEELLLSLEGSSPKEAQEQLKKAVDDVLAKHHEAYTQGISLLDQQLEERKKSSQEMAHYVEALRGITQQGLGDIYHLEALDSYLKVRKLYADAIGDVEVLAQQKNKSYEPQLIRPMETEEVSPVVSVLLGLGLGALAALLIGIVWALANHWWQKNKRLL